jgi:hypothetical protein
MFRKGNAIFFCGMFAVGLMLLVGLWLYGGSALPSAASLSNDVVQPDASAYWFVVFVWVFTIVSGLAFLFVLRFGEE